MADMLAQDTNQDQVKEPLQVPVNDPNDMTGDYQKHRENLSGDAELDKLLRRVETREMQKPAMVPKDVGQDVSRETIRPEQAGQQNIRVRPLREGGFGAWVNGNLVAGGKSADDARRAAIEATAPKGIMGTAKAVAADVGEGLFIEGVTQTAGGASDAVKETANAIDELSSWLNANVADLSDVKVTLPGQDPGDEIMVPSPTDLIRKVMPDIAEADTVTGNAVRNISKFITGFIGAGKVLKGAGVAVEAGSTAAKVAQAAAKGAISDFTVFDPMESRLSNLIESVPELKNPITEYLAASEGDSAIEGRFKNAIEGLGLGALTDAFMLSLKALRNARAARKVAEGGADTAEKAAKTSMDEARIKYGEVTDRDLMILGEPNVEDVVYTRPTKSGMVDKAMKEITGATPEQIAKGAEEGGDVFINWARIDTPEDVQRAMQEMVNVSKKGIKKAARGTRTNVETAKAAEGIDAFDVLLSRREGQALNAEESLALRQMWTSATEKLTEVAKAAADNPSEANLFAFRKMLAIQDTVQKEALAVRTETARALQSWKIPAGGGVERARAVQDLLAQSSDDPNVHRELARRIAVLGEAGETQALDDMVRGSVFARTHDAVVQVWINSLLSGPKTHLVNMMSNTTVMFQQMLERETASRIASIMGDDTSVQVGESLAQFQGMIEGAKDALRMTSKNGKLGTVWQSMKTGQSGFGIGKIDQPRMGSLASEVWNVSNDSALGRTLDTLNTVSQLPGRALGAEDELFKTIGYRMELHAQALRQASFEVNAGKIAKDKLKNRVADIIASPPEHIRLQALDAAAYQTFTNAPGEITKTIMKYRNAVPVLGPLTAPFARTPGNIMKYTFERTPLAPLMKHVRADIAAGGARRDVALARIGIGSTLMSVSADMALSGQISGRGPSDSRQRQALQRTGWQPYSVKVGDRWYAYNRMDPLGSLIGMSADLVNVSANGPMDEEKFREDYERATIATLAAIGANAMNKTYLQGMSNFVEAMSDPTRNADYWAQGVAGSLIPTGLAEVRRLDDPYMREARSMMDSIMNRTPGLSEDLPLRRDLWGRPVSYRSGMGAFYDAVSPIYSRRENPEPIDTELLRLGNGPSMPPRRMSFDGITINLDQYEGSYSRFVELAGNEIKLPQFGNKGTMDALNDLVTGKSDFSIVYDMRSDGPDGGKIDMIRKIVSDARAMAKRQLVAEFPEITVEIRRKQEDQQKMNIQ